MAIIENREKIGNQEICRRRRWHGKLWLRRLTVPPMMTKLSNWRSSILTEYNSWRWNYLKHFSLSYMATSHEPTIQSQLESEATQIHMASPGHRADPPHKGRVTRKIFPFGDVIMQRWDCGVIFYFEAENVNKRQINQPNGCSSTSRLILIWVNVFRYCRQISNTSCTKYQNLNVSCLILQLSLPNPLKPDVKSRMKM